MSFIVQSQGARIGSDTVVAPAGYCRTREGAIVKDASASPEMGALQHAYLFKTLRSAARQANKLAAPIVREAPAWLEV